MLVEGGLVLNVNWITTEEVDTIYFPKNFSGSELASLEKITFHFGSWQREVSVRISEDLPVQMIGLSENLRDEVFIPDLFYEMRITEDQVKLGPIILYLVSKRFIKRLDKIKERIENFVPVNGLILLSTVSGINTESETIEGYYFQPKTSTKEAEWIEGIFCYPGAIFKRVPVPAEIDKHLYERTNGCIFNSNYFSKWEMWKWLEPDSFIRNHLPYTLELNTVEDIYHMLEGYRSIYLKPKDGSGGKGIIQIKYDDHFYQIITSKQQVSKVVSLDDNPLIQSVVKKKNKYMIQQGVPFVHESRNIDFRIYMQKDETKQWKYSGLIARFAKPGSVTTNLRNLDCLLEGKEAFRQLFGLDQDSIDQLEQKVVNICLHACLLLDQHGCFGDIAIDFILDNDMHVWLLEMNKRYGYKSFSLIGDVKLFNDIIKKPFLYASALAGFGVESNREHELKQYNTNEGIQSMKTNTNYKLIRNKIDDHPTLFASNDQVVIGKRIVDNQESNQETSQDCNTNKNTDSKKQDQ